MPRIRVNTTLTAVLISRGMIHTVNLSVRYSSYFPSLLGVMGLTDMSQGPGRGSAGTVLARHACHPVLMSQDLFCSGGTLGR